jgi:hypothetical protein
MYQNTDFITFTDDFSTKTNEGIDNAVHQCALMHQPNVCFTIAFESKKPGYNEIANNR